jgi:hypothetical protein
MDGLSSGFLCIWPFAMTDLRKQARGRECQVRYPGLCSFDTETVVLAHIRMAGITGGAQKAPDIMGAWACFRCHQEADRVTQLLSPEDAKRWFLDGVFRTQLQLINEGLVKW